MTHVIPRDRAYFLARSETDENGCWNWSLFSAQAGHKRGGWYGRTSDPETKKPVGSHVAAYKFLVGPIPQGYEIDHTCRNTLCCNPDHLEAVTAQENNRRKWAAGDGRNQNTGKSNCPKCGEPYGGWSTRSDGRKFRHCVPCMKAYQAARYAANRDRIRARQNDARRKNARGDG